MRLGYYKVEWTIYKIINDNNWSIKKETCEISRIELSGQCEYTTTEFNTLNAALYIWQI